MSLWIEQPWWLLLLAAAPILAVPAVRIFPLSMSRPRAASAIAARTLLITTLALALAGAASVRTTDRLAVVAVIDTSDSIITFANATNPGTDATPSPPPADNPQPAPPTTLERIQRFLATAAERRSTDDLLGIVTFGASPTAVVAPTARRGQQPDITPAPGDGSDIAAALRYADLLTPAGAAARLLLVSDGAQTTGDAIDAARQLAARGITVDVAPIGYRVERETYVENLDVPPRAPAGGAVTARVAIRATAPTTGTLRLLYNGSQITGPEGRPVARRLTLRPGRNIATLELSLDESRVFHRVEAVFTPDNPADDAIATNNRAEAFTVTRGRGSILLVQNTQADAPPSALRQALNNTAAQVTSLPPAAVPTDLLELQAHDLVVLNNVPAWEVEPAAQAALVDHVSTMGAGLVMIGGETSFGAGGWKGTPLAEILPVDLEVPDEVLMSQAAVAIVLDASGSMARPVMGGNRSQQAIANAGAAQAVRSLDRRDQLMVVSFNNLPRVVVPMGPNEDIERNARRVEAISSGGGTRMLPAMRIAGDELRSVEAAVKHMIMLTDGRSEDGNAEMARLAAELNDAGITVTTIGVGDETDDQLLRLIAANGGGASYRVDDPRVLPAIFVKEVSVVRKPLIREGEFTPAITDPASPLILGVDGFNTEAPPPLNGLVLTQSRDDPKITYAITGPEQHPLLAHWFVGKGRVAAFTSDADPAGWARQWAANPDWPGFEALWQQTARFTQRPPVAAGAELETQLDDAGNLDITYNASDTAGNPIDGLAVSATVTSPDGTQRPIPLTQTAPGTYQASIPATDRGNYVVAVDAAANNDPAGRSLIIGGATKSISAEQQRLRSNVQLLAQIADITGGRVLDLNEQSASQLWQRQGLKPARASTPLWPVLLAASLALFAIDVGTRRLAWDRLLTKELSDEIRQHAAETVSARAAQAARTAGGLRERFSTRPPAANENPAPPTRRTTQRQPTKPADKADPAADARAAAIAAKQAERKRKLQEEALASLTGAQTPSPKTEPDTKDTKATDEPAPKPATEGLLAAKRRAAQRRKGRDLDPNDPPAG